MFNKETDDKPPRVFVCLHKLTHSELMKRHAIMMTNENILAAFTLKTQGKAEKKINEGFELLAKNASCLDRPILL